MTEELIKQIEQEVKDTLFNDTTGHDFWHIDRVRNNAIAIAKKENANLLIVELGALLHDIADHKFHEGDYTAGEKKAREILEKHTVNEEIIDQICDIVSNVSFSKGQVPKSKEGKIVQDADRLDALGAIGIGRTFSYGGSKGTPSINVENKEDPSTTIGHFYDKLLKLKGLMNTTTGKEMAEKRHERMEEFLENYYSEWKGK